MDEKDDKNFGFEKVTSNQKRFLVDEVFSDVANKYDIIYRCNFDSFSFQFKDYLINHL